MEPLDAPPNKTLEEITRRVRAQQALLHPEPPFCQTKLRLCLGSCACVGDCIWRAGINLSEWNMYLASQGLEPVSIAGAQATQARILALERI